MENIGQTLAVGRPILFLHIPKTAGTSFLLTLKNVFGDDRVRRITVIDSGTSAVIEKIALKEMSQLSCLIGHLPVSDFSGHFDSFNVFTILRDPIERVISFYEFLHHASVEQLEALSLAPGFTIEDMLSSRNPELYYQVNNCMSRMLSDDHRMSDSGCEVFWNIEGVSGILDRALFNLRKMDFIFADEMQFGLNYIRRRWSIPYALRQNFENVTKTDKRVDAFRYREWIERINSLDIALYSEARNAAAYSERDWLDDGVPPVMNARAVYRPITDGTKVMVSSIPGRQGFYEFEEIQMAWLVADGSPQINVILETSVVSFKFEMYRIVEDYPLEDIVIRFNGEVVSKCINVVNKFWFILALDRLNSIFGKNKISISMPFTVPVTQIDPKSRDRRSLGIAVRSMATLSE